MSRDERDDVFAQDLAADDTDENTAMFGTVTPATRAAIDERRDPGSAPRLGHVLRDARERAGLGLSDIAEVTHVRRNYLDALEEGRYTELPEDVYTRNFLRLYAQAVSLDVDAILELYGSERRIAIGVTTLEQRLERDRRTARSLSNTPTRPLSRRSAGPPAWLVGPLLPMLVLVGIVVGIGLWGFNQLFAAPGGQQASPSAVAPTAAAPTSDAPAPADTTAPEGGPANDEASAAMAGSDGLAAPSLAAPSLAAPSLAAPGGAANLGQVRVDVTTEPPGASVTIDGFPIPGRTPLTGIPVTGRDGRLVRAELDGYEPNEVIANLSADARIDLVLTPVGASPPAEPATTTTATTATTAATSGEGSIVINVIDTTWLEIYRSTARNVGDRLVYTTAQSGASFAYEPPIYVYVGNASGVRITRDGQDLGPMGSPGAVLGRAFAD